MIISTYEMYAVLFSYTVLNVMYCFVPGVSDSCRTMSHSDVSNIWIVCVNLHCIEYLIDKTFCVW
jgi:hypothetical protein